MYNKKSMKLAIATLLAMTALQSAMAKEGGVGNGGGAWVCRETNGGIRNAMSVDLFEANAQFGLTLAQYPGSARDIADLIMLRIYRINPDLAAQIQAKLDVIDYLQPGQKVFYTDDDLTVINDALYKIQPSQKRCVGGTISYGQAVNYDDSNDSVLVQLGLFRSLNETHEAALIMHEAIYAHLRKTMGDKDSVRARHVVGLLFSTLSQDDLKKALEEVLGGGGVGLVGMKFVSIQPGKFMMGEGVGDRQVILTHAFQMQTTDVTQAQWAQVMGNNPSTFKQETNCPSNFTTVNGSAVCPNHPVEEVTWNDAQNFIHTMNLKHDGYTYRLATAAEWEYAARAGTQTAYSFGDNAALLGEYAWFQNNSVNQTHDVATKKPNAFGLYDMHGNVWQWVNDIDNGPHWYRGDTHPLHLVCGGAYGVYNNDLRSGICYPDDVLFSHWGNIGFRLVRTK